MNLLNKVKLILAIIYMVAIFYISSIPNLNEPQIPFDSERLTLHFLEYFILGGLLSGLLKRRLFEGLIGICYGISDEIHQYFVPGRVCDPLDALADSIGTIAGIFFYSYISKKLIKND